MPAFTPSSESHHPGPEARLDVGRRPTSAFCPSLPPSVPPPPSPPVASILTSPLLRIAPFVTLTCLLAGPASYGTSSSFLIGEAATHPFPVLTPPKDSRSFSLRPPTVLPTLDLFLSISTGSSNRSGKTAGDGHGEGDEDEDGSAMMIVQVDVWLGESRLWVLFVRTSAFPFPPVPSPSLARLVLYAATGIACCKQCASYSGTHQTLPRAARGVYLFADTKYTLFDASPCGVEGDQDAPHSGTDHSLQRIATVIQAPAWARDSDRVNRF
ncbi:hypothetical protein B0H13DRAFT_2574843 [Mycena leptocephala]|nr:hypothetical protein B0H13DRAFT_2574843 [Mycena leptocephala]